MKNFFSYLCFTIANVGMCTRNILDIVQYFDAWLVERFGMDRHIEVGELRSTIAWKMTDMITMDASTSSFGFFQVEIKLEQLLRKLYERLIKEDVQSCL